MIDGQNSSSGSQDCISGIISSNLVEVKYIFQRQKSKRIYLGNGSKLAFQITLEFLLHSSYNHKAMTYTIRVIIKFEYYSGDIIKI